LPVLFPVRENEIGIGQSRFEELEPPPVHVSADIDGREAPQLTSLLGDRSQIFFIKCGHGKGAGIMKNLRFRNLCPIQMFARKLGAHAPQVEETALAR
jgi:hypothetical protein